MKNKYFNDYVAFILKDYLKRVNGLIVNRLTVKLTTNIISFNIEYKDITKINSIEVDFDNTTIEEIVEKIKELFN